MNASAALVTVPHHRSGRFGPSLAENSRAQSARRRAHDAGLAFAPVLDPVQTYHAYLAAVARRDFAAVVASMTADCAQSLLGLNDTPELGPLFDLWCESQLDPIIVTHHAVEKNLATIDVRTRTTIGCVTLRLVCGAWRIDAEVHQPCAVGAR